MNFNNKALLFSTGGGIFHYFIPIVSLCCAVFINSVTIGLVGQTYNLNALYTIFTINGLTTGVIDVGTNVWILRLFSDRSGPYIMALYTSFSLGTVLAPLYSAPFLQESLLIGTMSKIHIPYLITSIFTLIPCLGLTYLFIQQLALRYDDRNFFSRRVTYTRQSSKTALNSRSSTSFGEKTLVLLAVLMIMIYSGMEIIFSEYMISMLNRSKLNLTSSTTSQIRSATNAAYSVGKVIFIGISTFIRPYRIILLDSLVVIFSVIMLIIYFNSSLSAIWIFSILFGLGTSSLYPSIYPFVETFVEVDYFKGSFFICASGLTAIIFPVLIGSYLESTPTLILHLKLLTMIFTITLAIVINILGSRLLIRKQRAPVNEENDENQIDENAIY